MIFIGLDDTDIQGSIGTGRLARMIADQLADDYAILGVVRHQLFFDERVPYTAKNSSATILLEGTCADIQMPSGLPSTETLSEMAGLWARVQTFMRAHFQEGSDPGLVITCAPVPPEVVGFGKRAKTTLVTQDEAREIASHHGILLAGLGGTNDGVIGALASVGLAYDGDDGRYIRIGTLRDLTVPCAVSDVYEAGVPTVSTLSRHRITTGIITEGRLRPSRRKSAPVLYVEPMNASNGSAQGQHIYRHDAQEQWRALKFD
jgi:hypothetical protein